MQTKPSQPSAPTTRTRATAWLILVSIVLIISAVVHVLSLSWSFSLIGILLIASGALFVLIGLRR